eukprot:IDg10161t1
MSESLTDITIMSRGNARKKYTKLRTRIANVSQKDEHFTRFILVYQTILNQHKVYYSTINSAAILKDAEDVLTTMKDLRDAPFKIFTDNFFLSPIYPVHLSQKGTSLPNSLQIQSQEAEHKKALRLPSIISLFTPLLLPV